VSLAIITIVLKAQSSEGYPLAYISTDTLCSLIMTINKNFRKLASIYKTINLIKKDLFFIINKEINIEN